MGTNYHLYGT